MTAPELEKDVPREFRLDRTKLSWFLGFLEGRGRVRLPRWWSEAVLDAGAFSRGSIYFARKESSPRRPLRVGEDSIVTLHGEMFTLRVGKDSIVLPPEIVGTIHDSNRRFTGFFTPKNCYVADFDDRGDWFTLANLDRQTGKVICTTPVWGSYWANIGGMAGRGDGTIDVQGDRVFVFGHSIGIHVEAFRADTGKNVFRFSNGYSR